jgi:hypothetical protein
MRWCVGLRSGGERGAVIVRQIAICIIRGPKTTTYSASDLGNKDINSRQIRTPKDLDQY